MSISGLSNHLYVVVTTIISLLVAPSTFHQAHASPVSDDFTESRQFKKNLAVSKYKDNPHWLTDYVWKPPEKFYGPRKRPQWEMETTTESSGNLLKQRELEKWEKKMRNLSNRARQKWKIIEAQEKLQSQSEGMSSDRANIRQSVSDENSGSTEDDESTDAANGWMDNLHNGRWGMSVDEPAVEGFSTDSPKWLEKANSVHQTSEGTTIPGIISNGRWGMSVKEAPKNFMEDISKSQTKSVSTDSLKSLEIENSMSQSDDDVTSAAPISNGRWGMSVKEAPTNFMNEISKSQRKSLSTDSPKSLEIENSMSQSDDGVTSAAPISNGRWGMSVKEAPTNFMNEISKSQRKSLSTDSPKSLEIENSMSQSDDGVTSAAPISNGRWGMSVKEAPTNFMNEISKSQRKSLSTDSLKSLEIENSMSLSDDGVTSAAPISNSRWGMSVKKAPKNFMEDISKSQTKSLSTDSLKSLETRKSMSQPDDDVTRVTTFSNGRWGMSVKKAPKNVMNEISKSQKKSLESENSMSHPEDWVTSASPISNGRWGMNVKEAPKEFLKEMSRRSQTLAISDRVWKQDEDPKSTGNRKIHDGSEVRVKEVSVAEGPVETNLPKVFPSGRWGMSSDLPPREFLREISRRGLPGILEFYKSTAVHHRAHGNVKNNLQSRELMFSQMSGISNILFPRLFPSLIGLPTCHIYLFINVIILPDYNCALLSHILNQRQFL